jgi:diaminopropionate ammonia-lyase
MARSKWKQAGCTSSREKRVSKTAGVNFSLPYPFELFEQSASGFAEGDNRGDWSCVSPADMEMAHAEISTWSGYRPTPLHRLSGLANATGISAVFYKDEGHRFGLGSFKALGGAFAVFRLLQSHVAATIGKVPTSTDLRAGKYIELTRDLTVATATDGNHGRSVAWGSQLFGCRSVIYVPRQCSESRQAAIESYGACVVRTTLGYDETVRLCSEDAERRGRMVVSDTSWDGYESIPAMILQGYSVMTSEILEQLGDEAIPTHVFVQGGVGGLAAAVCAHFWLYLGAHRPRIIVVEPEGAACLCASARAGKLTPVRGDVRTIMAGLSCGEPSPLAWRILARCADFFVTIPDDVVSDCMKLLARPPYGDRPVVAGESAIAGLAGFLCVAGDTEARKTLALTAASRVLFFGTEGDTDPHLYEDIVGHAGDDIRKLAAGFKTLRQ